MCVGSSEPTICTHPFFISLAPCVYKLLVLPSHFCIHLAVPFLLSSWLVLIIGSL